MANLIRKASLRLPNTEIERHATWLEIFFDLIFAVIVIQISSRLIQHFDFQGIFESSLLFIPLMWTWASYTVFAARFDNNDAFHWIMTFVIMVSAVIMASQIQNAFETSAQGFSIGFLIGQICILLLYLRVESKALISKKIMRFYMVGFGSGFIMWMISLFFNSPIKFVFWAIGMTIYLLTPWIGRKNILSKAPLDTTYIPERFGAFTIIILGQIIASVVFGLASTHWNFYSILTSMMAFGLATIIFYQYYRFNQVADYKCTLRSGQPFIYMHIPLIIALIIMGVCTEVTIKNPIIVNITINKFFCIATVIYLFSFCFLQYLTIKKVKIRVMTYFFAILIILLFFLLLRPTPFLAIMGLFFIFILLLVIQITAFPINKLDQKIDK